mmetsp:Transcript_21043/g.51491  ORF Transcript_21043/g.51491 Transcript_21043/m.51491 type:complete len:201 (+) Transcript_21043:3-605(+)
MLLTHGVLQRDSPHDFVEIPARAVLQYIKESIDPKSEPKIPFEFVPLKKKLVEDHIAKLGDNEAHLIRRTGAAFSSQLIEFVRLCLLTEEQSYDVAAAKEHSNISLILHPEKLPSTAQALDLIVGLFQELKQNLIQESGLEEQASNGVSPPCQRLSNSTENLAKAVNWTDALKQLAVEHVKILDHAREVALRLLEGKCTS